uniref:cell division topological specificity factor MinE n=1 Tax=Candidatus Scatousia sp. TaxID=3085663 RepID=UPI00402663DB
MKEIFTDFYNTILGFFRQTEKKEENAKDVACNRLRVVLMQDRTNLTPELLQRMRQELIELLSKYVEMDKEALELNFEQEGNQMALMLSIPVLRAKEESEIEEAEAQDEAEVSDEDSDEEEERETVEDESEVEISEEEAVETSGNAEEEADEDSEKVEK